jgi:pimeloyl-ACP methyl ester carboxylesterase
MTVHHKTLNAGALTVFYREAGPADAPVVLLLHGFPTSSHMFRGLLPALADSFRVIAPDHLGFGYSDTPSADDFDYSFETLTDVTEQLLDALGIDRFAMYVQDYGAPIGWRLALRRPSAVTAVVSQSGNAYDDGFVESFWTPIWAYGKDPSPNNEEALRGALSLDAIRWQYLNGVPDATLVSPDGWTLDHALIQRPGQDRIQLTLFRDYRTNLDLYPEIQRYFRDTQIPLLAAWGANDEIFGPGGARAFSRDLPDAEIELYDGGHFLLESHLEQVAARMRQFLGKTLTVSVG